MKNKYLALLYSNEVSEKVSESCQNVGALLTI